MINLNFIATANTKCSPVRKLIWYWQGRWGGMIIFSFMWKIITWQYKWRTSTNYDLFIYQTNHGCIIYFTHHAFNGSIWDRNRPYYASHYTRMFEILLPNWRKIYSIITEGVHKYSDTKFHHRTSLLLSKSEESYLFLDSYFSADLLKIIVEDNLKVTYMPPVQLYTIIYSKE